MHIHSLSLKKLSVVAAMTAIFIGSVAAGRSVGISIILAQCPSQPCFGAVGNDGLTTGLNQAQQIEGPVTGDSAKDIITMILLNVLDFLALAAVIAIVVAGIILVVSGGNDEAKERAKKIIIYVVVGLVVVLFARLIVAFFIGSDSIFLR